MEDKKILLCDPMLATGGTVLCAINELLKHGVKEENITFMNVICCENGISKVFEKYPKISLVTGAIDRTLLSDAKYIAPGLGDFGCRYYGTWEN
jgi:uracil phosphoribosyltransferase